VLFARPGEDLFSLGRRAAMDHQRGADLFEPIDDFHDFEHGAR